MMFRIGFRAPMICCLLAAGGWQVARPESKPLAANQKAATEESIRAIRGPWGPLAPVGGVPTDEENRHLAEALTALQAGRSDKLSAFLLAFPSSPWKASILLSHGLQDRQVGRFSKALVNLEQAWNLSRTAKGEPEAKVADRALVEYADLLSRLGHVDRLEALVKEAGKRPLRGGLGFRYWDASSSVQHMRQHPDQAFRCGPASLEAVAEHFKLPFEARKKIEALQPTPRGTHLGQLKDVAESVGLRATGVRLDWEKGIPVPAILHSRQGHFFTVLEQKGTEFRVRDAVQGGEAWMSMAVMAEECDSIGLVLKKGVFVRQGQAIVESELQGLWGAGYTDGPLDPPDTDKKPRWPPNCENDKPNGMPRYSTSPYTASLIVEDIPLWHNPQFGNAIEFKCTYSQRNMFTPENLGVNWSLGYGGRIIRSDVPLSPSSPSVNNYKAKSNLNITASNNGVYVDLGSFSGYKILTPSGAVGRIDTRRPHLNETLTVLDHANKDVYYITGIGVTGTLSEASDCIIKRNRKDGVIETYGSTPQRVGYEFRLVKISYQDGTAVNFNYDNTGRMIGVIDAVGREYVLSYSNARHINYITNIKDPFGRSAKFDYNDKGQLIRITDMGGLTSEFQYGPTAAAPDAPVDFLNTLITPYGRTAFAAGMNGIDRWLEITDPHGDKERVEFRNSTSGMPGEIGAPSGFLNAYLYYRNTLCWDKRAMATAPGDPKSALIYHWLHRNGSTHTSSVLESMKKPNENRVWYWYGQAPGYTHSEGPSPWPLATAQLVGDGTEVRTKAEYNAVGKVSKATDAAGRETTYVYDASGQDVLEVRNTTGGRNDLLACMTYSAQHKPLTSTDASGQTTTYTYNASGQVTTVTNPKGECTTLSYDGSGFLTGIQGADPAARTTFGYDTVGRLASVTTTDGGTTTYEYDLLDRNTRTTYSDGTYEETFYDKLDAVRRRDRAGRWTLMSYNALRQLEEVQDSEGRVTRLGWCGCGSLENLTDPNGRITQWARDLQGRVVTKILDDLTRTNYIYDGAGRLSGRIDAKGQITSYAYFADGNLKQVSYPNALVPTPTVTYAYDPVYNRLATMVDGFGTTTYTYNGIGSGLGSGRLASSANTMPASTIGYRYDELGRVITRTIDNAVEERTFDGLGRLASVKNPLGTFGYSYDGPSSRLVQVAYPNGQKSQFGYFDKMGQNRLKEIKNLKSDGSNVSTFTYEYDTAGQIKTWSQHADVQTPKVYSFQYDTTGQLLKADFNAGTPSGQLLKTYVYGYDQGGNRISEQIDNLITTSTYNSVNQLVAQTPSDMAAPIFRRKDAKETSAKKPAGGNRPVVPKGKARLASAPTR